MLTIKSLDQHEIKVIVDGLRFEPDNNFMRVQHIQPGYHSVKIYRERNTGFFHIFGDRYEMVFNNSVMIRPRTNLTITIDYYGRSSINENRIFGWFGWNDNDWDQNHDFNYDQADNKGDYNEHDREWNKNDDQNWNKDYRNRDFKNENDGRDDRWRNKDDRSNGGFSNNGYSNVMNDFDFSRVLQSISSESFDSNKMKSASQIISTNYFTSAQVLQMLQLFSFESNKLQLAESAYDKTVDKGNYYIINDVFSFSSSKDELARYIRNH
jgi:hypothetical protein